MTEMAPRSVELSRKPEGAGTRRMNLRQCWKCLTWNPLSLNRCSKCKHVLDNPGGTE